MKLLKNYAYNLSYQLLVIILPIITTPYVTRVFSSSDLGTYGFYASISTYFILIATLGVGNYGTKEISSHSDQVGQTFWEIYSLQFLAGLASTVTYILACLLVPGMNNPVAYMFVISLISKTLDISWLFQGVEDFKRITMRNITVKLLGVVSIFLFVKSSKDLLLYIFFLVGFEMLGQLSMWWPARDYIGRPRFSLRKARRHLGPIFMLFLPQIAISLYVTLDRTMLGAMASTADVGIFDQAQKIISILLTVVTSLGTVMLPRVSSLLSDGDHQAVNRMHELSFLIYNLIIFPIIGGIIMVNEDFVAFFLGKDFQAAKIAIYIMVFKMFFIGWTNIMGIQILIPHNKNREFMLSTTLPAFFSVALNLILLPRLGFVGASITSLLAEALVWGIQFYYVRPYLKGLDIVRPMLKIALATAGMIVVILVLSPVIQFGPTLNVFVKAALGGMVYVSLVLGLKLVDLQEVRSKILKK